MLIRVRMGYIADHTELLNGITEKNRSRVQRLIDSIIDQIEKIQGYVDFDEGRNLSAGDEELYSHLQNRIEELSQKLEDAMNGTKAGSGTDTKYDRQTEKSTALRKERKSCT